MVRSHVVQPLSLAVAIASGLGSVGLVLLASTRVQSNVLRLAFIFWVFFPFLILTIGNYLARNWSHRTRSTLRYVTFLVSIVTLGIYAFVLLKPPVSQELLAFIAVPPVSAMFIVAVVATVSTVRVRHPDYDDKSR